MDSDAVQYMYNSVQNLTFIVLFLKAILHIIFAGAIARDAAMVQKNFGKTVFVGPMAWAFVTLVGGLIAALIYWFMHHSSLRAINS